MSAFDPSLVLMSYAISVFGSYTALVLASKVLDLKRDRLWLVCAAVALGGAAIWSMHFVGMLAYKAPVPVSYDALLTFVSMAVAIVVTGIGLYLVIRQRRMRLAILVAAGTIMGMGVAAMHYTGMAAIRAAGALRYDPAIVALSVLIAIVASIAALWIAFSVRTHWQKLLSAFVMGLAVCGMHYTAMYGFSLTPTPDAVAIGYSTILAHELAAYVVFGTMVVLATSLLATFAIEFRPSGRASEHP